MENFYSYTLLPYHVCIFDSLINLNTSNITRKPFHDGHFPSFLMTFFGGGGGGAIAAILKVGKQKHNLQKPILSSPLRCAKRQGHPTSHGFL